MHWCEVRESNSKPVACLPVSKPLRYDHIRKGNKCYNSLITCYTISRMKWHNEVENMSIEGGSHEHVTTKLLGGGADGARRAKRWR